MISRMIKAYGLFGLCIICNSLFAAPQDKLGAHRFKPSHIIMSLGGGAFFASDVGDSKIFPIVDPTTDEQYQYQAEDNRQTTGLVNIFIGGEWPLSPKFQVQAGISYYYVGLMTATGTLTQGADPKSSDQYDYRYRIRSQQWLAESKWLYTSNTFHPYISVGMGVALNAAKDYDVSIPAFTTFSRIYADNNTTSFTYNVGVGLDYDVSSLVRLGIGYRLTDLGKVHLGNAIIDTTSVPGTLSQSHCYASEVLAQLIFVI